MKMATAATEPIRIRTKVIEEERHNSETTYQYSPKGRNGPLGKHRCPAVSIGEEDGEGS